MPEWKSKYRQKKYKQAREYERNKMTNCVDCGAFDLAYMDWHHIDPSAKDKDISRLITGGYSMKRIKAEIDKCICLCSNCHRKRHYYNHENIS